MLDCKKHYSDMMNTRLGELSCPFCDRDKYKDALERIVATNDICKEMSDAIQEDLRPAAWKDCVGIARKALK